jgi:hypothetical protein
MVKLQDTELWQRVGHVLEEHTNDLGCAAQLFLLSDLPGKRISMV